MMFTINQYTEVLVLRHWTEHTVASSSNNIELTNTNIDTISAGIILPILEMEPNK